MASPGFVARRDRASSQVGRGALTANELQGRVQQLLVSVTNAVAY